MNIALWIVAGLLAVGCLASGAKKVIQSRKTLVAGGWAWADDFSAGTVKTIGVLEVLAGIGLILPAAVDIAPVLVPLAAVGLGLVMIGAIITHARRHESNAIVVNVVLLVLAAFVAWARFGPYSFSG
jgi:hypothetical protein